MAYNFEYPYTDPYRANTDWEINAVKDMRESLKNFYALNKLTYASPIEWNQQTYYEPNTIVLAADGNTYASIKAVPSGISYTNTDYWTKVADFNAQYKKLSDTLGNFYKELADYGVVLPDNVNIKTVGSAQYPTYKNAVESHVSGQTDIIVLPQGVYDITSYWTPDTPILEDIYIVGIGNVTIIGAFVTKNVDWSIINCRGNFGLYNLTLNCYQGRYAIHDDYVAGVTDKLYTRIFSHCRILGTNNLNHVVGGAMFGNARVIYKDCFINESEGLDAVFYHDRQDVDGIGELIVDGCQFSGTGANYFTSIRLGNIDNKYCYNFIARNSSIDSIAVETDKSKTGLTISLDRSVPILYDYDYTKVSCPDIYCSQPGGVVGLHTTAIETGTGANIASGNIGGYYSGIIIAKNDYSYHVLRAGSEASCTMLGLTIPSIVQNIYVDAKANLTYDSATGNKVGYALPCGKAKLFDRIIT